MITEPKLPWDYQLLAYVVDHDTALIITQRDQEPDNFVLHRMSLKTGDCYYGHYFRTYASALEALSAKIDRRGETRELDEPEKEND